MINCLSRVSPQRSRPNNIWLSTHFTFFFLPKRMTQSTSNFLTSNFLSLILKVRLLNSYSPSHLVFPSWHTHQSLSWLSESLIPRSDWVQLCHLGLPLATIVLVLLWGSAASWRATLTITCSRFRTGSCAAPSRLRSRTGTTVASCSPGWFSWHPTVG